MVADPFAIPRAKCRCGYAFGSLQAHLAHADLCAPLPHLHPTEVGLVEISTPTGPEWDFLVEATLPEQSARNSARPDSDFERTCVKCATVFLRPRGRGRPPTKCPDCRSK